ncbi:Na+/H+ antiporter NhaA [Undibacter mobilis]|uniref:Na(+)/H(+) antiporter NhaA n=1 Tax=Undibacter mobilis TaxID=2292256 RepID=A0A371B354_9BRAD|nr:Na+/H+ antiporter NhaA [Undibacter mobilis]RDV01883.1 Na+/H+ antiporter NhaA [Undibacter mobilis]
MTARLEAPRPASTLRRFLDSEAAGGLVLMAAAALALIIANSIAAGAYQAVLHAYIGPLSVAHWINDGLMAVFFLLVGLEIKREILDGQLATWSNRMLPGLGALGGMAVPAAIYVAFNIQSPETLRGWAVPTATDIAFALGVLSLLGSRVPASMKVFLAALAIIDDLGAVVIIAIFYTANISALYLGLAAVTFGALFALNKAGIVRLLPYLILGALLWFLVLRSGVHATVAGVLLAMTIPLRHKRGAPDDARRSPLHALEHALSKPVAFIVVPIFGFANAGVSFAGVGLDTMLSALPAGIAFGLLFGKLVGVFGASVLAIRLGLAAMPLHARWQHLLGVSLLCGIGFTMSLFIGLLAFGDNAALLDQVKIGILAGSFAAGALGYLALRLAGGPKAPAR